jgi:transketolase
VRYLSEAQIISGARRHGRAYSPRRRLSHRQNKCRRDEAERTGHEEGREISRIFRTYQTGAECRTGGATGSEVSLALETKKLLDARGIDTRIVSMPCWTLFAKQSQSYRDEVLPPEVTARMSIEAAATFGWSRWVGDKGVTFGIDRFGMSARAADIAKALGFTPEAVAKLAQDSFAFATR